MTEKLQKADISVTKGKRFSAGRSAAGKFETVTEAPLNAGEFLDEFLFASSKDVAREALLMTRGATLAAVRSKRSMVAEAQDPGLEDARMFSHRLQTGDSRVLSQAESLASRQAAQKELANIQKELDQLLRRSNP